jgi:hypothetical protein
MQVPFVSLVSSSSQVPWPLQTSASSNSWQDIVSQASPAKPSLHVHVAVNSYCEGAWFVVFVSIPTLSQVPRPFPPHSMSENFGHNLRWQKSNVQPSSHAQVGKPPVLAESPLSHLPWPEHPSPEGPAPMPQYDN